MGLPLPNLGPRGRKVARIAGLVVLALVTFVFALQLTFPYDRVKSRIEEELAAKYVVTIGDVERGLVPGRVYFNSISLQTRTTKPDETPSTVYIDRLEIDLGILSLIRGAASVNLDAELGGGHIAGSISLSKGATSIEIGGSSLAAQMLPMRELIGLPMLGTLEFAFALDLPNETVKGRTSANWQKAAGNIEISCPSGCTFGDGKTKLKTNLKNTRNQAFAEGGIEFGAVSLTRLLAKVEIKSGKLELTQFDAPSEDGTLHVDYEMDLEPAFGESNVTGCLRFNGSQSLLKRDPKTFTAISATGAQLGPDELFHIKLTDRFKDMRRIGVPCGKDAGKSPDGAGGAGSRPSLNAAPDLPAVRGDAGVPAIPTFTPPVPDPVPPAEAPGAAGASDAGVAVPVPGPDMPGSAAGAGHGSGIDGDDAAHGGHGAGSGSGTPELIR